ncbi:hypothetical protein DPSP01_002560 [Paraphaeosphaeria sporulosa]
MLPASPTKQTSSSAACSEWKRKVSSTASKVSPIPATTALHIATTEAVRFHAVSPVKPYMRRSYRAVCTARIVKE